MRRGWERPSGEESVIALIIMLLINLIALPVMGLAGICSDNPDEKVKGTVMFIIGAIIWTVILIYMAN